MSHSFADEEIVEDGDIEEEIYLEDALPQDETQLLDEMNDVGLDDTLDGNFSDDSEGEMGASEKDDFGEKFSLHNSSVFSVKCHPLLENIVVSGGGDDRAFLWNSGSGEMLQEFNGFSDSVCAIDFTSDGKYVACGGLDGRILVWESDTGLQKCLLEGPDEVHWVSWHRRGHILLCGSKDGTLWMWNIPNGDCMNVFTGHTGDVICGGFTMDGKLIISGSYDGTLRVWDPKTAECRMKVGGEMFHKEGITCLGLHMDGKLVVTGGFDKLAKITNITTGKVVGTLEGHEDTVESVAFAKEYSLVVTGSLEGTVMIWDSNSLRRRCVVNHPDGIVKLLFHPTSHFLLISSCLDGKIRLWDGRNGQLLRILAGHKDGILDFDISSSGNSLITAGDDSICLVFEL